MGKDKDKLTFSGILGIISASGQLNRKAYKHRQNYTATTETCLRLQLPKVVM